MIKKTIFIFILLLVSFSTISLAHILKTDNTIGAVLHTDPDDDPIAGQLTNFYFEFKDKTNRLDLNKCDCKVEISNNSNEILYRDSLFAQTHNADLSNPSFSFVFPQKNVYHLLVSGTPKNNTSFDSFQLSYDIRVAREICAAINSTKSNDTNFIFLYIIPSIILLVLSLFLFKKIKK